MKKRSKPASQWLDAAIKFAICYGLYSLGDLAADKEMIAATLGISASASRLFTIAGGVMINGVSQSFSKIKGIKESNLGPELERAVKRTYENTFKQMEQDVLDDLGIKKNIGDKFYDAFMLRISKENILLTELREEMIMPLYKAVCDNALIADMLDQEDQLQPDAYILGIIKKISPAWCISETGEYYLADYIASSFKKNFQYFFREELNENDHAKNIYFTILLETILQKTNGNIELVNRLAAEAGLNHQKAIGEFILVRQTILEAIKASEQTIADLLQETRQKKEPKLYLYANKERANENPGDYKSLFSTFTGRNVEMSKLLDFVYHESLFCWWAMIGPGGMGKSRLAYELAKILLSQNYNAGFLDIENSLFDWDQWDVGRPTLIVVDYALCSPEKVATLITKCARNQWSFKNKVRILILDREYTTSWLSLVVGKKEIGDSAYRVSQQIRPLVLTAFTNQTLWRIIYECLEKRQADEAIRNKRYAEREEIMRSLSSLDGMGRPLFALFAGLALAENQQIRHWDFNDLLNFHITRIEENVWKRIDSYKDQQFEHKQLIMANTLCRDLDIAALKALADDFIGIKNLTTAAYALMVDIKREPDEKTFTFQGITPDILGEYFIVKIFNELRLQETGELGKHQVTMDELLAYAYRKKNKNVETVCLRILEDMRGRTDMDHDLLINLYRIFQASGEHEMVSMLGSTFFKKCVIRANPGMNGRPIWDPETGEIDPHALRYFSMGLLTFPEDNNEYKEILRDILIAEDLLQSPVSFKGMINLNFKKYDEAIEDNSYKIRLFPNEPYNYNNRGLNYIRIGEFDKALSDFLQAILLSSVVPPDFYSNMGMAYYYLGLHEEAIVEIDKAIELNPDNDIYYQNRGMIYDELESFTAALDDVGLAIKLQPDEPSHYYIRALIFENLNKYEDAIFDYDCCIMLNRGNPEYYYKRGRAKARLTRYQEAVLDYEEAILLAPREASYYLRRAFAKEGLDEYDEAIDDYSAAIELSPQEGIYYEYRGETFGQMGLYEPAIRDFTQSIQLRPYASASYQYRAAAWFELKQLEKALDDCSTAIGIDPEEPDYYNGRGMVRLERADYEDAVSDFETAIRLKPGEANYYNNLGVALFKQNKYETALSNYGTAIGIDPSNGKFYGNVAAVYIRLGQFEEGLSACEKAIGLTGGDADVYSNKGMALIGLAKYPEAYAEIAHALSIEPRNHLLYNNIGLACFHLGRLEESLLYYDQAIEMFDGEAQFFANRGLAYMTLGRLEESIRDLDKAISIGPGNYIFYNNRALTHYHAENFDQAIADYDRSLELFDGEADCYANRALALSAKGKHLESVADLDRAIGLKSRNPDFYHERAHVSALLGDTQAAMKDYDKAIELNPASPVYYSSRSFLFDQLGKFDDAIKDCERAIALNPLEPDYWVGLGHMNEKSGLPEKALLAYSHAIELDSSVSVVFFAKGRVLVKLARYEEAVENYDGAIALQPEDGLSYVERGVALSYLNRHEEAIADYQRSVELKGPNEVAYNNIGFSMNELTLYHQALEYLDQAVLLDDTYANAFKNRAVSKIKLGLNTEALGDLDRAIELDPEYAAGYNRRGEVLILLGNTQQACEDFKIAMEKGNADGKANFEKYSAKG